MKYIKGLDSLRAFAVIFVVLGHWRMDSYNLDKTTFAILQKIIIPGGEFGVNLFFVLSGFLISSILLKAREKDSSKIDILKNFIIRRTLRIFPIYYVTIITLALINFPDICHYFVWFMTYTSNILCIKTHSWNAFSHTWSLAVEEQFYLIWPWLILFINPKYFKYLFIAFIITGPISSIILIKFYHGFNSILVPNCFDSFGIGGLYAYASIRINRMEKFNRLMKYIFPASLLLYFGWTTAIAFDRVPLYNMYFQRTVESFIAVWLINFVINSKSAFWQNNLLTSIGKISYGIYLYHFAIPKLYEIYHFPTNPIIAYFIKIVVLLIISYCSFYFFESKILKLKKRFEY